MTTAITTQRTLKAFCDDVFTPTGTIGYATLLKPDLTSNLAVTVNPATDVLTTLTPHGLTTGSRVRVASGGTIPSPLIATQDIFAIVLSSTTFRVAVSLADALSAAAINLIDTGSGSIVVNEQALTTIDPLAVLLAKEITHPAWTARSPIASVGEALIANGAAEKNPLTIIVTNTNATATTLTYGYVLLLFGDTMSGVIGSSMGITAELMTIETTPQSIARGDSRTITIKLRTRAA